MNKKIVTAGLVAGLLVATVFSGRMISRVGRYKVFPVAGTAILAVGMFLLSGLAIREIACGAPLARVTCLP